MDKVLKQDSWKCITPSSELFISFDTVLFSLRFMRERTSHYTSLEFVIKSFKGNPIFTEVMAPLNTAATFGMEVSFLLR
jgi:hypothetical protein